MIASVRGVLSYKSQSYIIVDVGGIGYQIFTSASSYQGLPDIGETVALSIYTYVREDALNLYGFLSGEEKDLFMLLLNVSGVGPKLSLNILSGISGPDLVSSIRGEDIVKLTSIPGIGKKMASRLIFELKEKLGDLFSVGYAATADETRKEERDKVIADVLSALMNLGYSRQLAMDSIKRTTRDNASDLSAEELIKLSLKILAK